MTRRRSAKRPTPARVRKQASEEHVTGRWVLVAIIAVSAVGTAVITIIGVGSLYRWALFLIALDIGAAVSAVTYAIAEPKQRILALSITTGLFFVLLVGIAIYFLIPEPKPIAQLGADIK